MTNKIKVSVIVAIHNQERYVGRCLRSLVSQKFDNHNFEIIAINDGSTDKTAYALELFNGDINIVTHHKNLGLPSAVNSGLDIARGEYIVRVDSDDYVNENFLTILSTFLDFNEECTAVCCDYFLIDEHEKIIERKNAKTNPIACGIIYRKEVFDDVGRMNEEFLLNEEKEFRLRFEKKYKVEHIQIPLYRYRRHKNNITNNLAKVKEYDELLSSLD